MDSGEEEYEFPPDYEEVCRAVDCGDGKAKTKLAWFLLSGFGGADVNVHEAIALLEERVEQKDLDAMWMLGVCSEFGIGVDQDVEQAELLYHESSSEGNIIARNLVKSEKNNEQGIGYLEIRPQDFQASRMLLFVAPWKALSMVGDPWKTYTLGIKGALSLSEFLAKNATLTHIDIGLNNIRPRGTQHIAKSLMINTSLTQLNLGYNNIGDEGAKAIGESLVINTSLGELNLNTNNIDSRGASIIFKSLMKNTTLTKLNLSGNNVGPEGAMEVKSLLLTNTALTELNLSSNCIGDEGALLISESLETNSTLAKLYLGTNHIGNTGAMRISRSIVNNTTLVELELKGNYNISLW